jgi:hypothetical protein
VKAQKWMLIGGGAILLVIVALVGLSLVIPFARAQGPMYGDGNGPMFERGFGPGSRMGRGMMFNDDFGPGFDMGPGGGPGRMFGMGGRWGGPENSLVAVAAEKLGMTRDELLTELQAGKSIAEVAAEKNVAVDTIVEAVLAPRTERINELVANGQLTQEQADTMLAQMKANVTTQINTQGLPQGRGGGFGGAGVCDHPGMGMLGGRGGGNSLVTVAAEKLGLTRAELITELQAGKSIAEVAGEKNVAVDTIVEAILAPRTQRLNDLVSAGQLTQAEVDTRLANLRVDLIDWLNQSWGSQNSTPDADQDQSGNY